MDKQLVFKTRHFARWMRKTELTNEALCEAVREMLLSLSSKALDANITCGALEKICHDDEA